MSSALHDKQTHLEGIHSIVSYVYADQSTREAASGFDEADLYKVALQQSDETFWILLTTGSSWQQVGAGASSSTGSSSGGPAVAPFGTFGANNGDATGQFLHPRSNTTTSTENLALMVVPFSGTLRYMASRATVAPGNDLDLVVRVNKVDTSMTYTHPSADVSFYDSAGSTDVNPGDFVSIRLDSNITGPQFYFSLGFIPSGSSSGGSSGSDLAWVVNGEQAKSLESLSVSVSGDEGLYASQIGSDVFFFVSGTQDLTSSIAKKAVFQGSTHFSSSVFLERNAAFKYVDLGNKGPASRVIDFRLGQKFRGVLTGSFTASIIDPPGACNMVVKWVQDVTGSRTIKLPSNWKVMSSSITSSMLSTSANSHDLWSVFFDGEPSPTYYLMYGLGFVTIP